jgi:hypothetical protein
MDAVGFSLATAFLAVAFTVFGILDRLLVTWPRRSATARAADVSGVRAWVGARTAVATPPMTAGRGRGGAAGRVEATEPVAGDRVRAAAPQR